jgi:pyrroline-5-carboxylate reductase
MVAMEDVEVAVANTVAGPMVEQLLSLAKVKRPLVRLLPNTEMLAQLALLAVAGVEQVVVQAGLG